MTSRFLCRESASIRIELAENSDRETGSILSSNRGILIELGKIIGMVILPFAQRARSSAKRADPPHHQGWDGLPPTYLDAYSSTYLDCVCLKLLS